MTKSQLIEDAKRHIENAAHELTAAKDTLDSDKDGNFITSIQNVPHRLFEAQSAIISALKDFLEIEASR